MCETETPCVARCDLKWCLFCAPEKPLPIVTPVTSTFCPFSKVSTEKVESIVWLDKSSVELDLNSFRPTPASLAALA